MPADAVASKTWQVRTELRKWARADDHSAGLAPDSIEEFEDNFLLNAGITRLLNLLVGSGTAFNAANCRIGVGDSATAADPTQTDLQAPTNKLYHLLDGAPTVLAQTVTFVATFGTTEANFTWAEWGIDNGTATNAVPAPPMLNRKAQAMGSKGAGVWTFTVSITIS